LTFVTTFTGIFAIIMLLRGKSAVEVFLSVYLFAVFALPG